MLQALLKEIVAPLNAAGRKWLHHKGATLAYHSSKEAQSADSAATSAGPKMLMFKETKKGKLFFWRYKTAFDAIIPPLLLYHCSTEAALLQESLHQLMRLQV